MKCLWIKVVLIDAADDTTQTGTHAVLFCLVINEICFSIPRWQKYYIVS